MSPKRLILEFRIHSSTLNNQHPCRVAAPPLYVACHVAKLYVVFCLPKILRGLRCQPRETQSFTRHGYGNLGRTAR